MRINIYCNCGKSGPHFDHQECSKCGRRMEDGISGFGEEDIKEQRKKHPAWIYCPNCGEKL